MLDFLRRAAEPNRLPELPADARDAPRLLLVRRSEVLIALAVAGLLAVLAFLLGLTLGGGGDDPEGRVAATTGIWVVRVATYNDTENGRISAQTVKGHLLRQGLDDVHIHRIPSQEKLVVSCGSWISVPKQDKAAILVRKTVREMRDVAGNKPFTSAYFWHIE